MFYRKKTSLETIRVVILGILYRLEVILRRTRQKIFSLRRKRCNYVFHILCLNRYDYVEAARQCSNSIWQHMPGAKVIIWTDETLKDSLQSKRGFDRKSDLFINIMESEEIPWQLVKLKIILNNVEGSNIYTDADVIWNGQIPDFSAPLFFVNEGPMSNYTKFNYLFSLISLKQSSSLSLLNVSVVAFPVGYKDSAFAERCLQLFETIRNIKVDEILGIADQRNLRRLSEQISLSISVQERGDFQVLKARDSVMDGGLAESYYLGSSRGWE